MQPLIKRFVIGNQYYVYDSNTNEIVEVDKIIWDIIEDYAVKTEREIVKRLSTMYTEEQIHRAIYDIHHAITQQGLLMDNRPAEIRPHFSREILQEKLDGEVSHMILGITEQCNFRCQYCIYSGHYKNFRQHSEEHMDMQTAIKAVNFFHMHCQKADEPSIGFYGGEPLLEFPLMQKVVDYVNKTFDMSINFTMTTNGSLLRDYVIRFLIDNKFSLLISLDGPEEIHDRYRKFSNGRGTFSKIYQNLRRFREIDEDFFCRKVGIEVLTHPPFDYERLYEFFSNDPVLKGVRISLSSVSTDANTFFDQFSPADFQLKGVEKLRDRFRKDLIENGRCNDNFLRALFEKPLLKIHKRKLFNHHDRFHPPRGICFPGVRRVFVKPSGDLLMCEKVSDSLVIGDVDQGYDLDRIFKIMGKYTKPLSQYCPNCWAIRLCSTCFADSFSSQGFDPVGKQQSCEGMRGGIIEDIREYCSILRENSHAFDYMKDIVIT